MPANAVALFRRRHVPLDTKALLTDAVRDEALEIVTEIRAKIARLDEVLRRDAVGDENGV